ncbi:MAG: hypothetical protein V2I62_07240 [Bacteroidales bacterium]|jgi:hypothetical protein|nr:hypothetical protein [Bacteroidales bacterium]
MINISILDNKGHTACVHNNLYSVNLVCTPSNAILYSISKSQKDDLQKEFLLNIGQYIDITLDEKYYYLSNDMNVDSAIHDISNKLSEIESRFGNIENNISTNKNNFITHSDILGLSLTINKKEKYLLEDNDHLQLALKMSNKKNEVELEIFRVQDYLDDDSHTTIKVMTLYPGQTITIELI